MALLAVLLPTVGAVDVAFLKQSLPPLKIGQVVARVHTQGLEVVGEDFWVTGRRDDLVPGRAMLLRWRQGSTVWDAWDLTPPVAPDGIFRLDHPGGFQSDGERLWIPLAESRRHGRSVLRAYRHADLQPGQPAAWDYQVPVDDHIGAVAVSREERVVVGASWDTENVYVWNLAGELQLKLAGKVRAGWRLGLAEDDSGRSGLTVQDWKFRGHDLYASGLWKAKGSAPAGGSSSRLARLKGFPAGEPETELRILPAGNWTEIGREGMAWSGRDFYFLPDDLGSTNQMYRLAASRWGQLPTAELPPSVHP